MSIPRKSPHFCTCLPTPHMPLIGSTKEKGLVDMLFSLRNALCVRYRNNNGPLATSLSSCESELYSIQQTAQDSISIGRVVARILWGIGEIAEGVETEMVLESDSSSALQLIQQTDVPKRSRHIEIRLLWLRSQLSEGKLSLYHRPGVVNMADLFTKCLGSHLFEKHRRALGFEPRDMPVSMMQVLMFDDDDEMLMNEIGPRSFGFVEVCCEPDSQLSVLTLKGGISYVGIVKDVHVFWIGGEKASGYMYMCRHLVLQEAR